MKYELEIVHNDGKSSFTVEFTVPLPGVESYEEAIHQAQKLKDCLSDDYIVGIVRTEKKFEGFVISGTAGLN